MRARRCFAADQGILGATAYIEFIHLSSADHDPPPQSL
jgi:hypothetical protein